jgi:hypothetical protein
MGMAELRDYSDTGLHVLRQTVRAKNKFLLRILSCKGGGGGMPGHKVGFASTRISSHSGPGLFPLAIRS